MEEVHKQTTQPSIYGKGKRWAVLVGINEYEDKSNYGSLHVCVEDAKNIRNALIEGGFEEGRIHLLTDKEPKKPMREEIVASLQSIVENTGPDDLLLFYFSGHGVEEKGESYLVPCNGKGISVYDTALPLKRIKEIVDEAPARAKVIILDACHAGANIGTKESWSMPEGFIERVFIGAEGMAVLASCKQRQKSHEWKEKHCSVYTYYLLEALRGKADYLKKGFITVHDINLYTVDKVMLWASQHQVRQKPDLNYFVDGDILVVNCQKQDESPVTEEVSQRIGVPSGQDYLTKLQEVVQSALAAFTRQNVWGADCQPILEALNQLVFPALWQELSSSSFAESPFYSLIVQLYRIDEQRKEVISLIDTYMQGQQGGATQIKEIKNIFTSLLREIDDIQKSISSLEEEQANLILGIDISPQQQEDLEKYIGGDREALREGRVHEQLTHQFTDKGARPKKGEQMSHEDVFARFKRIPLHALVLFTSEDQEVQDYVLKNWGALGDLSKDICDFHLMLNQFDDAETGYEHLQELDVVRQSGLQKASDLPAILFHDNYGTSEYISLATAVSERDIKIIIRAIFDEIKQQPTIASITRAKQFLGQQSQRLDGGDFVPSMNGKDASSMSSQLLDECNKLIEDLEKLPTGDGKSYEEIVKLVLEICLVEDFASFSIKEQIETYYRKRIRDFIIDNRDSKVTFWHDLKLRRGVEKILFDAKNYKNKVKYREITSTLRYLKNKAFGNFMIIISRWGIDDWTEIIEDYGDEGKIILSLDDKDLIAMIEMKKKGERASSIIEGKYYSFLNMK